MHVLPQNDCHTMIVLLPNGNSSFMYGNHGVATQVLLQTWTEYVSLSML